MPTRLKLPESRLVVVVASVFIGGIILALTQDQRSNSLNTTVDSINSNPQTALIEYGNSLLQTQNREDGTIDGFNVDQSGFVEIGTDGKIDENGLISSKNQIVSFTLNNNPLKQPVFIPPIEDSSCKIWQKFDMNSPLREQDNLTIKNEPQEDGSLREIKGADYTYHALCEDSDGKINSIYELKRNENIQRNDNNQIILFWNPK